jgi:hypothetical protein
MSAKQRWSKFYWQDWKDDSLLSLCSLAAQGLWIRLLCHCHEGTPYGHLAVNGVPLTDTDIARLARTRVRNVRKLLAELEHRGVFSRTPDGLIFSRRLVLDGRYLDSQRAHGKLGGNPVLVAQKATSNATSTKVIHINTLKGRDKVLEADTEGEAEKEGRKKEPPQTSFGSPPGGMKHVARGTRLAADWKPGEDGRKFALSLSLDLDAVTEDFRDHWLAKPGTAATSLDWNRSFRKWCREAARRESRRPAARKAAAPDWWAG